MSKLKQQHLITNIEIPIHRYIVHDDDFLTAETIRGHNAQLERPYCQRHWDERCPFGDTCRES